MKIEDIYKEAIKDLDYRDRTIMSLYYSEELNYKEIAQILGTTVARIIKIHQSILKRFKKVSEAETVKGK